MRKLSKKAIGLLLVIVLCISIVPISAMATDETPVNDPGENALPIEPDGNAVPAEPSASASPTAEPADFEPTWPEAAELQTTPASIDIEPELFKLVDKPLVQVTYHYYDEAQNQSIADFEDYMDTSSHTFYADTTATDTSITIAANKFPTQVTVSTDALRFRVIMNGGEDITAQTSYDAATGTVTLPRNFAGHEILVEWYCPVSEILELQVPVTISINRADQYTDVKEKYILPSNADVVDIPLSGVSGVSVSQNGVDLPDTDYTIEGGTLSIRAAALGGPIRVNAAGVFAQPRGQDKTSIISTRDENQIFYGFYTKYYWADGNQAYCLDPTVRGASNGEYAISRYLDKNGSEQDQTLTKIAYYSYGAPGFDSVKSGLFGDGTENEQMYALCHVAASYVYLNDDAAFKGLGQDMINHVKGMVASFASQSMPHDGFDAFIYNEGNASGQQPILGWDYTPTGSLEIQKVSSNPALTDNNEAYSLANAVFGIYNGSDEKVGEIITDVNGRGKLEGIGAGQTGLYIVEETPPPGYAENKQKIPFEIQSGQTTTITVSNKPQGDPVTILLRKKDGGTNTHQSQGSASLASAEFTIKYYAGHYTESEIKGKTPARTWIVRTDADGFATLLPQSLVAGSDPLYYASNGTTPTIPLGTVTVQESKAPTGFLINNELFVRQITSKDQMESVSTYNEPIVPEEIIRGGVSVSKWDYELDRPTPQGDANLAATLDIYNRSPKNVLVNGKMFAPNEIVHTLKTDAATGSAATAANLLPYGDYEIVERPGNQPEGYLNTGKISQKFSIRQNGVVVNLGTDAGAIKNNPIRGSFYMEKWDAEIDRNEAQGAGTLDAAVEIINRSRHLVLVNGVEYLPGAVCYTAKLSGDGKFTSPARLLPYGSYEWREAAPPSQGYLHTGILSGYFLIRKDGETVKLNTSETAIKNNPIRGDLKGVKISDSDGNRMAGIPFELRSVSTDEAHIVITDPNGQFDTSSAWNPHSQNTNRGETDRDGVWFGDFDSLDDDAGALLYDDYLIEELSCAANKDMELLSFEVSVYRPDVTLDLGTLTDDYVKKPEIFTTAMDQETVTGNTHVSEQTTILDTVHYAGLQNIGKEYMIKGVLMDKSTGAPLLIDGQEIRSEKTFRALSENGSVAMEFTFNSTALADKSVVVFESLEFEGKEIAAHADIEDGGQTVTFKNPQIGTSASGLMGEKELDIYPDTKIIDVVSFSGLMIDQTYTLTGKLMDKETGEPLLIDGQEATVEKSFVPKTEAGTVEMSFTVNAATLKGKTVVVFESLKYKEREIAVHADIEDNGQTVTFKDPQIGTSATGAAGEKEIIAAKTATIVDTVSYKSLAVGKTYTVKGVLMDKETGNPLTVDGKEITAETTFVAKEESGSVEVVFTLDAVDLAGKSVVVFESLYYGDTEIAAHADIEDEGQTVTFKTPKIGTKARAEDNGKIVPVSQSAKVIDTVSYENLVIGEEYHLKAVLMDKATGKAVLVDGKEVTAETTFVAKTASDSVDVVFTFNTTALQDKILVVFESLEYDGEEIATHADINDEAQTVTVGKEKELETGTGAQMGRDGLPLWLLVVAIGAGIAGTTVFAMWKKNSRKG